MHEIKKDISILQSVQNGMRILHLFTHEKPMWGVTEIANKLKINKSTVSRLIRDLMTEGYIQKEKNKYCLGYSFLYLSGIITSHLEIYRESKDILHNLVNSFDETAHISILEGIGITYVLMIESRRPTRLMSEIGKSNPIHCTSSGKVLLAYQKEEQIKQVIDAGLNPYGPNSVTEPESLIKQLVQIKKQGYSICIDELHENSVSIAAPIRDYTGSVIAAVSVVGLKHSMDNQKINTIKEFLIQTAKQISNNLGYVPDNLVKEDRL